MKSTCKTCGKNCEGEYCFRHKPRKKLSSNLGKKLDKKVSQTSEMRQFFLKIWKKRLHYSQISFTPLGKEPLITFFHHILPKEKYPQAMFDEENIVLLTLDEHTNVETDMYRYETINIMREKLLKKYETK
ncbi:MAG: hypothetical protein EBR30_01720 [Cytophagia bacterium]|nr:hypothetical protein [Cytophagia bacterium]